MIFWLKLHIMLMFSLNSFSAGIAYSFSLPTVFLNSFSGCLLLYSKSPFVTTSNLISVQFDFPVSISRTGYLSVYCSPEEEGLLTYSRLLRFKNALSPISLYKPMIYIDPKSFFIQLNMIQFTQKKEGIYEKISFISNSSMFWHTVFL